MAIATADELTAVSPPPDRVSRTLLPPPSLSRKPRLEDFQYREERFPAVAPSVPQNDLDVTISLVSTILNSKRNDMALSILVNHQVMPSRHLAAPR